MKYLCVKDYWMEGEKGHVGCIPAFAQGVVYEFEKTSDVSELVTPEDNQGEVHYMSLCELTSVEYFTLVEEVVPESPTTNTIEQWLDKYQQVASTDYHIGKIDTSDYGVCLTTDHGDILGSKQVVEFIHNRYSQLKSAENQSKLKELQAKKDKLMLELASVGGEINELGGVV